MKAQCESMLAPTASNWKELLRTAERTSSHRLLVEVKAYLRDHLNLVVDTGDGAPDTARPQTDKSNPLASLGLEYPGLLNQLVEQRSVFHPLPPSALLISRVESNTRKREEISNKFPWIALTMAMFAIIGYHFSIGVVGFGPYIPIVNGLGLLGCLYYGVTRIRND